MTEKKSGFELFMDRAKEDTLIRLVVSALAQIHERAAGVQSDTRKIEMALRRLMKHVDEIEPRIVTGETL